MKMHPITPTKPEQLDMLHLVGVNLHNDSRIKSFILELGGPMSSAGHNAFLWLSTHSRKKGDIVRKGSQWHVAASVLERVPACYAQSRPALRRAVLVQESGLAALACV